MDFESAVEAVFAAVSAMSPAEQAVVFETALAMARAEEVWACEDADELSALEYYGYV